MKIVSGRYDNGNKGICLFVVVVVIVPPAPTPLLLSSYHSSGAEFASAMAKMTMMQVKKDLIAITVQ